MLKEDVVNAVKEGKFHLYSAKTIDDGIEVLTGIMAGEKGKDGTFDEGTVNYKVNVRLKEMAERLRDFVTAEAAARKKEEE